MTGAPWIPAFQRPAPPCPDDSGIVRCLDARRAAELAPFLAQYRRVRARDGYRQSTAAYYRALPWTPDDDPQHDVWQVRQRSFERFRAMLRARFASASATVLDLGAGCGWLSHRLTGEGYASVAVDLIDDDVDGLGAGRHYDRPFLRVQADFDDLPFAPRQFDVIVFNGSLHYAPRVRTTLMRVAPLLTRGGVLAVLDSPFFACPLAGQSMRDRVTARLAREYGETAPIVPGEGYLLFTRLADAARTLGLDTHFFESRGGLRWSLGRVARRWRDGVTPPSFGVWWAA